MRSYCVRQRKQTECIPNSERITTTSNGRKMIACVCAECGSTKTQFMKGMTGSGSSEKSDCTCGIEKGKKPCSMLECAKKGKVNYWGIKKVDKRVIDYINRLMEPLPKIPTIKKGVDRTLDKYNMINAMMNALNNSKSTKTDSKYEKIMKEYQKAIKPSKVYIKTDKIAKFVDGIKNNESKMHDYFEVHKHFADDRYEVYDTRDPYMKTNLLSYETKDNVIKFLQDHENRDKNLEDEMKKLVDGIKPNESKKINDGLVVKNVNGTYIIIDPDYFNQHLFFSTNKDQVAKRLVANKDGSKPFNRNKITNKKMYDKVYEHLKPFYSMNNKNKYTQVKKGRTVLDLMKIGNQYFITQGKKRDIEFETTHNKDELELSLYEILIGKNKGRNFKNERNAMSKRYS